MDDADLRYRIYGGFAETGKPPTNENMRRWVGGADGLTAALKRLHDAHAIVLGDDGGILMALPFSAVPTPHLVSTPATSYYANCAWDTFGIAALLEADVAIDSIWGDDSEPLRLAVTRGRLSDASGYVHFPLPARQWWDDIVDT